MNDKDTIRFRKLRGSESEITSPLKPEDVNPNQSFAFDNDGNIVVRTRAYRRRKIQMPIDERHLPKKKPRKKNNKKNYLKKRKK